MSVRSGEPFGPAQRRCHCARRGHRLRAHGGTAQHAATTPRIARPGPDDQHRHAAGLWPARGTRHVDEADRTTACSSKPRRSTSCIARPPSQWGTVSSAITVPITISSCEFDRRCSTARRRHHVSRPPESRLWLLRRSRRVQPDRHRQRLTASTVSVVNSVVRRRHRQQRPSRLVRIASRFETILNNGGFVDVLVPMYGSTARVGAPTATQLSATRSSASPCYEFNGAPANGGDYGGTTGQELPDRHWPRQRTAFDGDFVRFVASRGCDSRTERPDFGATSLPLPASHSTTHTTRKTTPQ